MARVYVGLSGGVDSAVSAALLQEAGHEVTGVFIKIWRPEFLECTWREDRLDAMRVAAALGLSFQEVDLSEEYEQYVVREMISAYEAGRTPNPDISCNEYIKFGAFAAWAFDSGADQIATGHHAQLHEGMLSRGVDRDKDQSYFLYRITKSVAARTICPVGAHTKAWVREEARQRGLPVANRPDSQGLCFVGDVTIPQFLSRYTALRRGPVYNARGEEIGVHDGAALYTIGQRHGFHLTDSTEPHYVIAVDAAANAITVSPRLADAARSECIIQQMHWIDAAPPLRPLWVQARYRERPVRARVDASTGHIQFDEPRIVAPGQALVVYDGDQVLGGGVIA